MPETVDDTVNLANDLREHCHVAEEACECRSGGSPLFAAGTETVNLGGPFEETLDFSKAFCGDV